MARKPRSRKQPIGARARMAAVAGIARWAGFTWGGDNNPVFGRRKIKHVLVNWVATLVLAAGWFTHWQPWWKPLAVLSIAGIVYTAGRAARHLPARRKTVETIHAATKAAFKHPTSTRTMPMNPADRVKITAWSGAGKARAGAVVYEPEAPAAHPTYRASAERSIEAAVGGAVREGEAIHFTHDTAGQVSFAVIPADDPLIAQQRTRRWIETVVHQLFPSKRGQEPTTCGIAWADPSEGERPDVPQQVSVTTGSVDTTNARFRDDVESAFDKRVDRGVVFTYDWSTPGLLTITGNPPDSPESVRKLTGRKISDVTVGAMNSVKPAAAKATFVEVADWLPDDTPLRVAITMGTADFSNPVDRYRLEQSLDQALEQQWPDRVWLSEWDFGATTAMELAAVPSDHEQALRKRELRRLRQVVVDKFPAKRGQAAPDVEVHDWTTVQVTNDAGKAVTVARATKATVTFGTVDVSDPDTRLKFETHFDSLTSTNDWRYEWEPEAGRCVVTAVPVLRDFVPFPNPGTAEFHEWNDAFRKGIIFIGPAKGGYRPAINLNTSPHALVGGATGKGKSVLLTLFLFGALYNPDLYQLVVVDPKVTDFTWVGGYPNVLTYAPTDARQSTEQIAEAVKIAMDRMTSRQNLLSQFSGYRKLSDLRKGVRSGEVTSISADEIPMRLLVFFDEGGAAFTPSKDSDTKAVQDASRTDLENIGMLGRAMEVNIIMAAQKPGKDNIGTALREHLVNRISFKVSDSATSIQIMGNNMASTLLTDESPIGRGVFCDDTGRQMVFQCYYLPDNTDTVPARRVNPDAPDDAEDVTIVGVKERVAERLELDGWQRIITKTTMVRIPESGSNKGEPIECEAEQERWVRPDQVES